MLAKLIVHAPTRALAIARMRRALQELAVDGVDTSRDFHLRVLAHPDFQSGAITIQWLEQHLEELTRADAPAESRRLAALAAALATHAARGTGGTAPALATGGGAPGGWAGVARREGLRLA
jgi:acetyl-CoA carboxylase biotin carboxylase subunit